MDTDRQQSRVDVVPERRMTFEMFLDWYREHHACLCDLMELRAEALLSAKSEAVEGSEER